MPDILKTLSTPSPTNPPPTVAEERRNLILIMLVAVLALSAGWGLKWLAQNATQTISPGNGLPAITYPARWVIVPDEASLWQAIDPDSSGAFKARLQVSTRQLEAGDSLDAASIAWLLQRSSLPSFRNLATRSDVQMQGHPASLLTYAYVTDPRLEVGQPGLPVVVQAQDLLWVDDATTPPRLLVLTVAAEAATWDEQAPVFQRILRGSGMEEVAP